MFTLAFYITISDTHNNLIMSKLLCTIWRWMRNQWFREVKWLPRITQIKWKSQQLKLTLNPTATWKLFSLAASRGYLVQFSTVQSLSCVRLFVTPWIAARQASLSITYSDSRSSSQWCHPAISSSVVPFSSCPQSLPASGSFSMSQLFT